MKSIWFIINPNAGTDRKKLIADYIHQVFDSATYDIKIIETKYAGHAITLAQQAADQKIDIVVAVGGDGSVNEVAKGLIHQKHTALGIIPLGSGNGIARSIKIPIAILQALDTIKYNRSIFIDTCLVNDNELMLSNLGLGFDTVVTKDFANNKKRGFLTYVKLVTQHLIQYKAKSWQLEVDGQELQIEAFMLNIVNANQFGYNFVIDPIGKMTDGKLEMVVIKPFPLAFGAEIAIRGFTNSIHKSPYTDFIQGTFFKIKNIQQGYYQIDGDFKTLETDTLTLKIQPQSLKIICP